jgi:general stress protein 26
MKSTVDQRREIDEHLEASAAIAMARALLPSLRSVMLVTKGNQAGEIYTRPMGLQGDLSSLGARFPDGVDHPQLALIRIDVTNGTFWASRAASSTSRCR